MALTSSSTDVLGPSTPPDRPATSGLHYAWVVVCVTVLTLLTAAGVRAAPGVLIKPLDAEFGWGPAAISLAVAVSILAFGLGGRDTAAQIVQNWYRQGQQAGPRLQQTGDSQGKRTDGTLFVEQNRTQ